MTCKRISRRLYQVESFRSDVVLPDDRWKAHLAADQKVKTQTNTVKIV